MPERKSRTLVRPHSALRHRPPAPEAIETVPPGSGTPVSRQWSSLDQYTERHYSRGTSETMDRCKPWPVETATVPMTRTLLWQSLS